MPLTTDSAASSTPARRVLSGMRPTGKLHLGNYMGALKNWVRLQHETNDDGSRKYECYFFIADYHALTTDYADPRNVAQNTLDVALDWLGAGLDPEICTLFVQSHVPQHAELHLLLSMITPLGWLERVPTYKEQQENLSGKDLSTYGFLGYPLLQSADILVYQADFVPVGQDQVAHVELTREVARRFGHLQMDYASSRLNERGAEAYGAYDSGPIILPEPQVLLTPSPKLPGTDGRKMSKSYNNTILLTDLPPVVDRKLRNMTNGGQRPLASVPGDPKICPVGDLHRVFSDLDVIRHIEHGCRNATITCIECKHLAAASISTELAGIQTRRSRFDTDTKKVAEIFSDGAARARRRAEQTLDQVKTAMGLPSDLSRIHVKPMFARVITENAETIHSLMSRSDWWDLDEPKKRGDLLRGYWLDNMLPPDISVRSTTDRTYVTTKGKRIFVTSARDILQKDSWHFEVRNKSFEALVFLLWNRDRVLVDLVVPQRLYRESWPHEDKKAKIVRAYVRLHEGEYYLSLNDPFHLGKPLGRPIGNRAYEEIR